MNLEHLIEGDTLTLNKDKYKKIFFFRICGTGMGACACLLKEAGLEVEGADLSFSPPMSTYLESTGIPLYKLEEVDKAFLQKYDLIVVGNSVPRMSDHARMVEESGVDFTSFPALLGQFVLKNRNVVGITGTHGKTTTTFFLTQLLENLGLTPGYLIGGIIDGRAPSRLGKSDYFVIEGDEYDSGYFHKVAKFRLYELDAMLLTSLEFDHADIYSSIEDIKKEFRAALPRIKTIISCDEYPTALELKSEFPQNAWTTYGKQSEIGPHNVETSSKGSQFVLNFEGENISFKTNIIGLHNIYNITACLSFLLQEGFESEDLKKACANLKMVKRRQEVRGRYKGAVVIDDFAHHPKAVTLTIEAIKATFPDKKIITIFEPISATARSSLFQKEFTESLKNSDKLIMAQNSLKTTVGNSENLNSELIVEELNKLGKPSVCVTDLVSLRGKIDELVEEDSVLLILSNRTCLGLWESDFVQELK